MTNSIALNLVLRVSLVLSVQAHTKGCCSLSEAELSELRGTNSDCPIHPIVTPNEKCECPEGMCRLTLYCLCPTNFLSKESIQSDCRHSFGKAWPATIGEEDPHFKRFTQPGNEPDETNVSCCSMSLAKLIQLNRQYPDCPGGSISTLNEKCRACPAGSCRVDNKCICPKTFFFNRRSHCKGSFGVPWPTSIGREDVDNRSCNLNGTSSSFSTDTSNDFTKYEDEKTFHDDTPVMEDEERQDVIVISNTTNIGNDNKEDDKLKGGEIVGIVFGIIGAIGAVISVVIEIKTGCCGCFEYCFSSQSTDCNYHYYCERV